MFNNLFEIIQKSGIKISDSSDEKFRDYWMELSVANYEILPINYSFETYEYQYAYFSNHENFENFSKILLLNEKPVALWPIFRNDNKYTMYGGDLSMPFFSKNMPLKLQDQISSEIIKGYFNFLKNDAPISLKFNISSRYISKILSISYTLGLQPIIGFEQLVNLDNSMDDIFAQIRKSYKSLINQSKRLFNIKIHTNVSGDLWNEFRSFHFQQSGRVTRSIETWEIQRQHVNSNKAILITVQESDNNYLGFALFNFNYLQAIYAVGAYDRERFNSPIAHGVQWEAIKYFKEKGLRKYIIGTLPSPTQSDSKQYNIARFKMGFGHTEPYLRILN